MQNIPIDDNLLREAMQITGLTEVETIEKGLRLVLSLQNQSQTRKIPNATTIATFEATDQGRDLTHFDSVADMFAFLKEES